MTFSSLNEISKQSRYIEGKVSGTAHHQTKTNNQTMRGQNKQNQNKQNIKTMGQNKQNNQKQTMMGCAPNFTFNISRLFADFV